MIACDNDKVNYVKLKPVSLLPSGKRISKIKMSHKLWKACSKKVRLLKICRRDKNVGEYKRKLMIESKSYEASKMNNEIFLIWVCDNLVPLRLCGTAEESGRGLVLPGVPSPDGREEEKF